jgi:hypothetical protein
LIHFFRALLACLSFLLARAPKNPTIICLICPQSLFFSDLSSSIFSSNGLIFHTSLRLLFSFAYFDLVAVIVSPAKFSFYLFSLVLFFVFTGADSRFTPGVHQQALATGPFGNTYEVDAVSPKADMRGCRTEMSTTKGISSGSFTMVVYHASIIQLARSILQIFRFDLLQ